ncbi:MAG: class I SAM-dependent rRNA methyltransferase [bacterium]
MFEIAGSTRLLRGEEKRIRAGHLWIYRDQIDWLDSRVSPGDLVEVLDSNGKRIGIGAANPKSWIVVRMLATGASSEFNQRILAERIDVAVQRRKHLICDAKRLVNGEGDLIPGLIVDRYRDVIVVQIQAAVWEKRLDCLVEILRSLTRPRAIVLKNDSKARATEGLERYSRACFGEVEANVVINEQCAEIEVDVINGQKTGFYIDQRLNRLLVLPFVKGRRVLDCFCYTGCWSILCAKAGAENVIGIDCSESAISLARANARRNNVDIEFMVGDVFDELSRLAEKRSKFDVIILDPPSLATRKSEVKGAIRGFKHLNRMAMGLLELDGILVTCSCSHHLAEPLFDTLIEQAASLSRRKASLILRGGQPEDHPSLIGLPETSYLRCAIIRLL